MNAPALLVVDFIVRDRHKASLTLHGQCEPDLRFTIMHDGLMAQDHVMGGNESVTLSVINRDAVMILVRERAGSLPSIVACGLFEVRVDLASSGMLLVPLTVSQLLLEQHDARPGQWGIERALERVFPSQKVGVA